MDRQTFCSLLQSKWPELQREAIVRSTAAISGLTADDVCNRFLVAGEKYGEFDLNSINTEEELMAEFTDICSYIFCGWLQNK